MLTEYGQALAVGAIPKIAKICTDDPDQGTRKKAIRALSSMSRNYQPALDESVKSLPSSITGDGQYDAADMDSVDALIQALRDHHVKA